MKSESNARAQVWQLILPGKSGKSTVSYSGGPTVDVNGCKMAARFTDSQSATSGPCFIQFAGVTLEIFPRPTSSLPFSKSPAQKNMRRGSVGQW